MAISLLVLSFKANENDYKAGEEVELVLRKRCAGCGKKVRSTWLKHIPKIGPKLFIALRKRHLKYCASWQVLGSATHFTDNGCEELVLFGRDTRAWEEVYHKDNNFLIMPDWPDGILTANLLGCTESCLMPQDTEI